MGGKKSGNALLQADLKTDHLILPDQRSDYQFRIFLIYKIAGVGDLEVFERLAGSMQHECRRTRNDA